MKFLVPRLFMHFMMTHDLHDHIPSPLIIFSKQVSSCSRKLISTDGLKIGLLCFLILGIRCGQLTDTGKAQTKQMRTRSCAIALKIPVKLLAPQGHSKLIIGQSEMIQPNEYISG